MMPSSRDRRMVFLMVLMILVLELIFLTTINIKMRIIILSLYLRFPALYAVQTALMVTARLRTKTRPGGTK